MSESKCASKQGLWISGCKCASKTKGDPHVREPHGGRFDFRGEDKTTYNWVTASNFSLNIMTELGRFPAEKTLREPHAKVLHASVVTQAHIVARTKTGKTFHVSCYADGVDASSFVNGTVGNAQSFVLAPGSNIAVEGIRLGMSLKAKYTNNTVLKVETPEFDVVVSKVASYTNAHHEGSTAPLAHYLDITISLRVAEAKLAVPPHGILGQGWDGDGKAIDGERDTYSFSATGEFTTSAMGRGAIEGTPIDYKLASPLATAFKFSRFDATSASPRDVAKLSLAGVLNKPKVVDTVAGKQWLPGTSSHENWVSA